MTLQVCNCCSTKCAVGLDACPHCSSTDLHEEGEMPKITVHGGPSYAEDVPAATDEPEPEVADEDVDEAPAEETEATPEAEVTPEADEDPVDETETAPADEPVRPAASASKAKWVAYVEALGEDPGDRTRDELAGDYGD